MKVIIKCLRITIVYVAVFFFCLVLAVTLFDGWPGGSQVLFAFLSAGIAAWANERRIADKKSGKVDPSPDLLHNFNATPKGSASNQRIDSKSRLEIWRDIVSTKPEPELDEVVAGRDAELALRSMVSSHLSWKSASIFHSKRVPANSRSPRRGRYEVDLIVLSQKQISAIEIKNWSGSVRILGSSWIQERRNGKEVIHDDPLDKNQKKLESLCAFLEAKNIRVPKARISRVILWNRNVSIPSAVARRDEIVMHHELERFLSHQKASGFGERFLMSVLELCLEQEASQIAADGFFSAIPVRDYDAATRAISQLESFDKLELYGGKVLSGDLLELRVNGQSIPLKDLPSGGIVRVECIRSKLISFFAAVFGSRPMIWLSEPFGSVPASPRDRVLFHPAGQEKPE
ncbi:NERD domain-containing protein, partial [Salipiger sp. HF18]|uniref:nuclease-related domain-containing protein n=1 Tax=Salipiger sp. HF18 TaxID=2721557 RepID=UPI00142D56C1